MMANNHRMFGILFSFFFIVTCASPALAADTSTLLSSSLRMIWGLLVVLGILLIIYGLAKKRLNLIQGGGKGLIKVVETRHLMPKKSLFLVEVRGREFLLGMGNDTINLIAEIDGSPKPEQTSFDDLLQQSKPGEST